MKMKNVQKVCGAPRVPPLVKEPFTDQGRQSWESLKYATTCNHMQGRQPFIGWVDECHRFLGITTNHHPTQAFTGVSL